MLVFRFPRRQVNDFLRVSLYDLGLPWSWFLSVCVHDAIRECLVQSSACYSPLCSAVIACRQDSVWPRRWEWRERYPYETRDCALDHGSPVRRRNGSVVANVCESLPANCECTERSHRCSYSNRWWGNWRMHILDNRCNERHDLWWYSMNVGHTRNTQCHSLWCERVHVAWDVSSALRGDSERLSRTGACAWWSEPPLVDTIHPWVSRTPRDSWDRDEARTVEFLQWFEEHFRFGIEGYRCNRWSEYEVAPILVGHCWYLKSRSHVCKTWEYSVNELHTFVDVQWWPRDGNKARSECFFDFLSVGFEEKRHIFRNGGIGVFDVVEQFQQIDTGLSNSFFLSKQGRCCFGNLQAESRQILSIFDQFEHLRIEIDELLLKDRRKGSIERSSAENREIWSILWFPGVECRPSLAFLSWSNRYFVPSFDRRELRIGGELRQSCWSSWSVICRLRSCSDPFSPATTWSGCWCVGTVVEPKWFDQRWVVSYAKGVGLPCSSRRSCAPCRVLCWSSARACWTCRRSRSSRLRDLETYSERVMIVRPRKRRKKELQSSEIDEQRHYRVGFTKPRIDECLKLSLNEFHLWFEFVVIVVKLDRRKSMPVRSRERVTYVGFAMIEHIVRLLLDGIDNGSIFDDDGF